MEKKVLLILSVPILLVSTIGFAATVKSLPDKDKVAAFKAAGYVFKDKQWRSDCEDPEYTFGEIDEIRDLNGDGFLDVVITENSAYCYGSSGAEYTIVSKQANGTWKLITSNAGVPEFLSAKGFGGWPDISVGGTGFCFPVERWNGKKYKVNRFEYDGKRCKLSY